MNINTQNPMAVTSLSQAQATNGVESKAAEIVSKHAKADAVVEARDKKEDATALDFTSMTRKDLMDWVNEKITSGEMTFDESSPFLAMTLKISAVTNEPVDMATDISRIDFIEKAFAGIERAILDNDLETAESLKYARDLMLMNQGKDLGVDTLA